MSAVVDIYSKDKSDIKKFLELFLGEALDIKNINHLKKCEVIYNNPIYCADIIGSFIDNEDKFKINLWVSLDKDLFINITKQNADKIIRYLFERYPY